jgi:alpha-amylase/alpha-mannosidase (GH57 family)
VEKFVCIHGHFYQPPRENPSLEAIEVQDSAYPYHDWNERITVECYAPNASSRILDGSDRIVRIVNNYARMSFNFGPTLLQWMAINNPEVYQAIIAADHESRQRFSGHGAALAQTYNHLIMPLANTRDKYTQVVWGIRDFEWRFGRAPEGMWLSETAVDLETLDMLAAQGIKFTILAPYQAARIRKIGETAWNSVDGGKIDPSMPYRMRLPSGRTIAIFFYDGPISAAVAFEHLLDRGDIFVNRLLSGFSDMRKHTQLVHIATDGETYGHHHRHGDMALAYALETIASRSPVRLTIYGEHLERFPPTHEVEIHQNTSWSCFHGVERWRSDCGCYTGGAPGWSQSWRAPLRAALDWLRDTLAPHFEALGSQLLRDPWVARDDYISVVLDRSRENVAAFLATHAARPLSEQEQTQALKLLEMQRHAMLMYTSCGWFFSELSGVETVQVIMYAGRALQLAQELFGDELEGPFLELLERAKSNIPNHRDGRHIYEAWIKPALVDLQKVGAHYAISSLFEEYDDSTPIYCYTVDREDAQLLTDGRARLALGQVHITSTITHESLRANYGVLHLNDHYFSGGIRPYTDDQMYAQLTGEIGSAFQRADLADFVRLIDKHFGSDTYTLKLLFRDEQRKIVQRILDSNLAEAELIYRQLYEQRLPLMRFVTNLDMPLPKGFQMAAEFVLNNDLRRALEAEALDRNRIAELLEDARGIGVTLDTKGLGLALQRVVERITLQFQAHPDDLAVLTELIAVVSLARSTALDVSLWKAQNAYYTLWQTSYPTLRARPDESARLWAEHFITLGEKLGFRVTTG